MSSKETPLQGVKALLFDVFGTSVNWRDTITSALQTRAEQALHLADDGTPMQVRQKAKAMNVEDWGRFAQQWRKSYYNFTRTIANDPQLPYKSVDEHFLDSLNELIMQWGLVGLWSSESVTSLAKTWHKLDPWPDSVNGIRALNKKFQTCTLSNGNVSLLSDMAEYAKLEWTHVFSAEMFKTYKPNPDVYLGAAKKLGLQPQESAMVAAHLGDLDAAHRLGLRTIYIERPQEEEWDAESVAKAKQSGWVDLWITESERGFLTAAERLGIS